MLAEAAGLAVLAAISPTVLAWLPMILYLAAAEPATRRLAAFNGWLRRHGPAILLWCASGSRGYPDRQRDHRADPERLTGWIL